MGVLNITHSYNGKSALNYVLHGLPHFSDLYITKRVLMSSAVNCTVNGVYQQMGIVWRKYRRNPYNHHRKRQIQRMVQSFDPEQLDYRNPRAVKIANEIGKETAKLLYPNNQSIIVTQADGHKHVLHNHILTNMINPVNGKSITGYETSFERARIVSDAVIHWHGLDPLAHKNIIYTSNGRIIRGLVHKTHAEINLTKNGHYSWVADLRKRLNSSFMNATGWNDFIKNAESKGITVNAFKKKRINGKRQFRKHISYRFHDKSGKLRRIRDTKLGGLYSQELLQNNFSTPNETDYNKITKSRFKKRKREYDTKLRNKQRKPQNNVVNSLPNKTRINQSQRYSHQIMLYFKAKDKGVNVPKPIKPRAIRISKPKLIKHYENPLTPEYQVKKTMNQLQFNGQQDFGSELDLTDDAIKYNPSKKQYNQIKNKIRSHYQINDKQRSNINKFFIKIRIMATDIKKYVHRAKIKVKKWLGSKWQSWHEAIKPKIDPKIHHISPTIRFNVTNNSAKSKNRSKAKTKKHINKKATPSKTKGMTSIQVLNIGKKLHKRHKKEYKKWRKIHLDRCPYWSGFIKYYHQKYPKYNIPKPNDKDYLESLHQYVIIKDQNKYAAHNKGNLAGFQFNKSERRVNIEVRANPNDKNNYTKPWYALGVDDDPYKGPQK